jgi:hypothetical protein
LKKAACEPLARLAIIATGGRQIVRADAARFVFK